MKKIYALALCSLLLISCDSNNDTNNESNESLSIEDGKNQLEDNSIALLNKIEDFKNDQALNDIIELAEFLSSTNTSKLSGFKKTSFNTISNISKTLNNDNDFTTFSAKQAITLISGTPLNDDYNAEKGVYQWNNETDEFEKIGESEDVIYNIDYLGKTAVFSLTDFSTILVSNSETEEEVPTLAKANLKINNTVVFSQEFSASFSNNQLIPISINNTTALGAFTFETSFTNTNNSSIKQLFNIKIGNDVIIGYNSTVNGNFNNEVNIEDKYIEDVVNDATVSFQILNAFLTVKAKDTNLDSGSDLSIDEEISLLNNNIDAELAINQKSIASLEFYKDQDTYTNYVYNSNTQQFEMSEITEDIVNARFLFADGSSSDFHTYFDGSFTSVENKFETVFDAYEALFGDIQ